ncbi:hypothetical protein [Terriglobus roseus]|uniref:SnoaL-like domain-containing protein n=1 Tax=Terriglobus roseus TaxID=392734 RepID=A0A1H4NDG6_9BACT|nr:hypothetical protein [Terriglobus roseus]SEB93276.1 hypothetical protein SAMN05443244_2218 [Terriglobus roseus]
MQSTTSSLRRAFLISTLSFAGACAAAQTAPAGPPSSGAAPTPAPGAIASHPEWPKANPDDVKSPQAIIAAVSDAISGEAGTPRDWQRVRSLFVPVAGRMVVTRVPKTGPSDVTVLSLDDYEKRAGGRTFYERPIAYDVQSFGRTTHVYESYGIRHKATDAEPYVRGVNSFELLFDGTRYYILQIFWDTERPDNPLPAKLSK